MSANYPPSPQPEPNEPFQGGSKKRKSGGRALDPRQIRIAAFLVIATFTACIGWLLSDTGFTQTSLYFVLVPGLVAALVAVLPSEHDGPGVFGPYQTAFVIIFGSAIIIREGVICMVMATPLILLVIGVVQAGSRSKRTQVNLLVPLMLLVAGGEGIAYELPTNAVVVEERTLPGDAASVEAALANADALPEIEPLLFQLPFPKPTGFISEGNDVGDRQAVEIGPGTLEMVVSERAPGHVVWTMVDDTTPIAGWYGINTITMDWHEVATGGQVNGVAVEIAVDYDRRLAPAAYFDPLGRFGVGEFAEVLLDMIEANQAPAAAGQGR